MLKEAYGSETYEFLVQGIYDYPASLTVFYADFLLQENLWGKRKITLTVIFPGKKDHRSG